ncbi:hypothetical protein K3495_g8977 [Podosphaera aphanis]|nr:hypothetical protein K3495_g8977 [Podosphaera aphanis]
MSKTYTKFAILAAFYLSLATVSSSLLTKRDHAIGQNDIINCGIPEARATGVRGDSYSGRDALNAVQRARLAYIGGPNENWSFGGEATLGFPKDSGFPLNAIPGYPGKYLIYPMAKGNTWPEKNTFRDLVLFNENYQAIAAVRPAGGVFEFCEIVQRG